MRNTHTSKQTSKRGIFAQIFECFPISIDKILLEAQISEHNKKLSTATVTDDTSQDNKNITPTAPQFQDFQINHQLFLVPRNYRHTPITEHSSSSHSYPQSPVSHIVVHQPKKDVTYDQIVEQPHTTNFRSQNSHVFSPR